jgi:hypothetical protein
VSTGLQKKLGKVRALAWPPYTRGYAALTARTKIINIGDSRGICIPKPFLEQSRLGDEMESDAPIANQLIMEGQQ